MCLLKYIKEPTELSLRSIVAFFRIIPDSAFETARMAFSVRSSLLNNSSLTFKTRIYYNKDISIPRVIKDYNS